jgi:hypothetical protein
VVLVLVTAVGLIPLICCGGSAPVKTIASLSSYGFVD